MLRFLTAGESHGSCLTAILEGFPAGLAIDIAALEQQMAKRRRGFGSSARMRIERDGVEFTGGVLKGETTGAPIALVVENRDHANWSGRTVESMTVPRPGHADLAAAVKYGYTDLRLALERASARETAARVAVGALCAQLLGTFDVSIGSYVVAIGPEEWVADGPPDFSSCLQAAESSAVRCPDPEASERMRDAIRAAERDGDTLGGVFEVVALGLPPGLGSHVHWDRRLTGRLLGALTSIPAVKGAEVGRAFDNARRRGSAVHDRYILEGGRVERPTNRGAGLEGGITTGAPLLARAAMKPIATTLEPLESVDLASGRPATTSYQRSDICAVPRAAVVAEAMMAYVLADALLEKVGGDSLGEMRPCVEALRRANVSDLPMDDRGWQPFGGADE